LFLTSFNLTLFLYYYLSDSIKPLYFLARTSKKIKILIIIPARWVDVDLETVAVSAAVDVNARVVSTFVSVGQVLGAIRKWQGLLGGERVAVQGEAGEKVRGSVQVGEEAEEECCQEEGNEHQGSARRTPARF
jgi:hypothetical protein